MSYIKILYPSVFIIYGLFLSPVFYSVIHASEHRVKVGIIGGGGAGLTLAWLLDNECQVTLFESKATLGGHARTVYVPIDSKKVAIEAGFEFFNKAMYPNFYKLLTVLKVPLSEYEFTYTFFTSDNKRLLVLPPIQPKKIFWKSFSGANISNLLQLNYVIRKGRKLLEARDTLTTVEQFLNKLWLTASFKDNTFLPLFCAGWGVTPHELKSFSAYNVLSYIIKNKPIGLQPSYWQEIVGGTAVYIEKLRANIARAIIKTSSSIAQILYNGKQYEIVESNGNSTIVDHIVVATDPYSARDIVKKIAHARAQYNALARISFIQATIVVHDDLQFMPQDTSSWSVANVCYNGRYSALTIYKKWKSAKPIFRSWLLPGFAKPKNIYAQETYHHPKPNQNYFKAQKLIDKLQGIHNLWFVGLYTQDIDSHESAILSALKVGYKLAPDSQRIALLNI
jgi:predicted NAD/FAD-binding protein